MRRGSCPRVWPPESRQLREGSTCGPGPAQAWATPGWCTMGHRRQSDTPDTSQSWQPEVQCCPAWGLTMLALRVGRGRAEVPLSPPAVCRSVSRLLKATHPLAQWPPRPKPRSRVRRLPRFWSSRPGNGPLCSVTHLDAPAKSPWCQWRVRSLGLSPGPVHSQHRGVGRGLRHRSPSQERT